MDLEINRHDWGSLQGVSGSAPFLGVALRELGRAQDRVDAELAAQRINREIFATGLLCSAAPAVAISLVHILWARSPNSEDLILGLLSDIAESEVYEEDPTVYGSVTKDECLFGISMGFPAYVEILESSKNLDSVMACVDLLFWCGLFDERLKERCVHFLRNALVDARLSGRTNEIAASIDELFHQQ